MPLSAAIAALSDAPARALNLPGGHLSPGAPADLTLIDLNAKHTVGNFASKSQNSPFIGWTLQGKATAVIVNPTHYAVALQYSMHSAGAPTVVAKGKNYLALRIKQRAIDNDVPLVENPPLAQALYKSVDVGQEIPAQFYRAVAEILAYIHRLMNGRLPA